MFKIEKPEYVNKTFRIRKELFEELQIYASQNNISVNELVVQCCKYALENKVNKDCIEKSDNA